MRRVFIAAFTVCIYFISGLSVIEAQPILERISIVERADSRGYVLRYHLTEMVQSFNIVRPDENVILMELMSPGFTVSGIVPITQSGQIRDIDLVELEDGVGVIIYLNEGVYFQTDVYPDINGRDVLLSLETATRNEVLQQISEGEYFDWFESEVEELETRPSEFPVIREETPLVRRSKSGVGLKLGVLAGVSSSNVFASDFSSGSRNGTTFGLSADISTPFILPYDIYTGIETGFFFTQKGFENPDPQFLAGTVFEFDYIEIPVLAKFSYDVLDFVSPYVIIGPSIGFMVNAERVRSDDARRDLDDFTKAADISVVAGIGVDVKLFGTIFSAQIKSSLGASNVFKEEPEVRDMVRFRHRSLFLVAGIRF